MSFENPMNKRVKKLEEQLQNNGLMPKKEVKEQKQTEQIIPLDDILKTSNKEEDVQIELIDFPRNVIITGVPRGISVSTTQLGSITIKYENSFYDNIKQSM